MPSTPSALAHSIPITTTPDSWREKPLATMSQMMTFLEELAAELLREGWSTGDIFAIRLAVEEAVVNAIKHGHQHDSAKCVQLRYRLQPDSFLSEVEDQGPGFDPHDLPDPTDPENLCRPCGRGVFLMRHYMTWVRFNDQGNCVTLCKYRSAV